MSRINPVLLDRSLDFLSDVAVIYNRALRCIYINAAGARLLGQAPERLVGRSLPELMAGAGHEGGSDLAEVFRDARRLEEQHEFRDSAGEVRRYECVYCPIQGHHGQVELVIGIWRERPGIRR